jgi:hypothetical protein
MERSLTPLRRWTSAGAAPLQASIGALGATVNCGADACVGSVIANGASVNCDGVRSCLVSPRFYFNINTRSSIIEKEEKRQNGKEASKTPLRFSATIDLACRVSRVLLVCASVVVTRRGLLHGLMYMCI